MPWPQTCATQYLAQLEFSDKGRAIIRLVVCSNWEPAKRSVPRLLSTVPCGIIVFIDLIYNNQNINTYIYYYIKMLVSK